jgi:small subunit ribosomal protein S16
MLVIRFNRTGRRNAPLFRLVVQEKVTAPGGRHVEVVGNWNPHKKEGAFKNDRILHWIEKGAQPSDSVHNLLVSQGVIDGEKRSIKVKKPEVSEETIAQEVQKKEESEVSQEDAKETPQEEPKKEEPTEGDVKESEKK